MLLHYFSNIFYHILTLIDSIVNILGSLLGKKRVSDISSYYLLGKEAHRIYRDMNKREEERLGKAEEALNTMMEVIKKENNGE